MFQYDAVYIIMKHNHNLKNKHSEEDLIFTPPLLRHGQMTHPAYLTCLLVLQSSHLHFCPDVPCAQQNSDCYSTITFTFDLSGWANQWNDCAASLACMLILTSFSWEYKRYWLYIQCQHFQHKDSGLYLNFGNSLLHTWNVFLKQTNKHFSTQLRHTDSVALSTSELSVPLPFALWLS